MPQNSASLYVHIPFCKKKCSYCDFFSIPKHGSVENLYIDALVKEAGFYSEKYSIDRWTTIYIGGGTPSLLSAEQLSSLVFRLKNTCMCSASGYPQEITVEMNPESVTKEKLFAAADSNVTRLSVGIQSLNGNALSAMERYCSAEDSLKALDLIKYYWKGDLNLDVMAGLPFQNDAEFSSSLEKIISYTPDHISLYTLTVEEGTVLEEKIKDGIIEFDSDAADSQWLSGRDILLRNGFIQYEVSNFCRSGKKSLHNSSYWAQKNYVGIGCGATGTIYGEKTFRWTNLPDVSRYENFWMQEKIEEASIPREIEELDMETREFEFIMTGLRTSDGINSIEYKRKFSGVKPWNGILRARLGNIKKEDLFVRKNSDGSENFSLSKDALLFLNRILLDL